MTQPRARINVSCSRAGQKGAAGCRENRRGPREGHGRGQQKIAEGGYQTGAGTRQDRQERGPGRPANAGELAQTRGPGEPESSHDGTAAKGSRRVGARPGPGQGGTGPEKGPEGPQKGRENHEKKAAEASEGSAYEAKHVKYVRPQAPGDL